MGKIRVLDDHLVNRIAAGEVVERPASVVKELVENSLDAGAARVDVCLVAGGKQSIRVLDDGEGMDRDDALLALERHATSKLAHTRDLQAIGTLGFRGEALPSIAAVTRLMMRTAPRDGEGVEIEVSGGKILGVREAAAPRGTSIEASSLFYGIPARRKFLRSEATELSHVTRLMTRCCLAHPTVSFRLENGARPLLDVRAADDQTARLRQIVGRDALERMLPFARRTAAGAVHGFAGRPSDAGPGRDAQHLFVNGRVVQDRVLLHAVSEAYRNTVARDRHPAVFVFLDVDPGALDVNVHPQKTEVRFAAGREVHDLVRDAIAGALGHVHAVPSYGALRPGADLAHGDPGTRVAAAVVQFLEVHERAPGPAEGAALPVMAGPSVAVHERAPGPTEGTTLPAMAGPSVVALAQYRESYVVAQDALGLLVVDQHAAHERVLFEKYLRQAEENRVEVQRLLFPRLVDLGAHERVLLAEEKDEFRRLGFVLEAFGGDAFRLDGIPAVAADLEPESLLRELLGEAATVRAAASAVGALRLRLVTTAACKAAIKIHHPLSLPAMQGLLDDLFGADNPTTCPHGRPIVFRLTTDEIERAFRRR